MHENVVRLFGVVELANGDIGAVVEFCAQGALVDALYGEKARELSAAELMQIAYDAACGVMHLHECKIVHRDIAARNVLLAGKKDLVAKVSDFGMARDIESVYSGISNEQHTAASIGPVKWMAPEQLERMAYKCLPSELPALTPLHEFEARKARSPSADAGDAQNAAAAAGAVAGGAAAGAAAVVGAQQQPGGVAKKARVN
jgi:serine/threonine protein kinase